MVHGSRGFQRHMHAPYPRQGQILTNLVAGPAGPPLEEGAAMRSDSRGLRDEASS